jgi:hypothetical protein
MRWPDERAILLVHGVGNAKVGDYADLVRQVQLVLGDQSAKFAVYMFYYDQVNDWFAAKERLNVQVARLLQELRGLLAQSNLQASDSVSLGNAIAEVVGDVVWPILIADARNAVRTALIDQLNQVVMDGDDSGILPRDQQITIIAHSMGCFHVYEALHSIAAIRDHALGPATGGVQLDNVVFMASPVQLISTLAGLLGALVPQRESLRCVSQPLGLPVQQNVTLARRTVAITGTLDPVGGHFFRTRSDWAYMKLDGQESLIDPQQLALVNGSDEFSLTQVLHDSLRQRSAPVIQPSNPHSWSDYVQRHESELKKWLTGVA